MNILLQTLKGLSHKEERQFWTRYLIYLARSIKVTYAATPEGFIISDGFKGSQRTSSLAQRENSWYSSKDVLCWTKEYNFITPDILTNRVSKIPIFPNYANKALREINYDEDFVNLEETNMKNETMNNLVNKNKTAVAIAAKLATGKTANSFFMNKLVNKLPWYAKLFGKKKEVETNPLAKLITAQTAMALATHFASDNRKLNYIAESMVEEAMVDIAVNSTVLDNLIQELEKTITIPNGILD